MAKREGWKGWDEYAPFYDWENAQTLGRRDVAFWRNLARDSRGKVLELGCGTGRLSLPLLRAGTKLVGVDRSAAMLERAAVRVAHARSRHGSRNRGRLSLVRADVRALPFQDAAFSSVFAPYGVLQSLVRERDLKAALETVARVLRPGGVFGVDLVPDVPKWREYKDRVQMKGRAGPGVHLTLVESVRQDPRRHLTIFEQTYVERRNKGVTQHRFELAFRTLPMNRMIARLERAGFRVDAVQGDYRGGPWNEGADVWVILAHRLPGVPRPL